MDCGFIQRECQCEVFNVFGNGKVNEEEVCEVLCKATEWKSTGTQTDLPLASSDPGMGAPVNFSSGLRMKTPDGQLFVNSVNKLGPAMSSAMSMPMNMTTGMPPNLVSQPPLISLSHMTPFAVPPMGFMGGPPRMRGMPGHAYRGMDAPGMRVPMEGNAYFVPPDLSRGPESTNQPVVSNVFKMDRKTGMFVNDDFSLDPKTGKITKRQNPKKDQEENSRDHDEAWMSEDEPLEQRVRKRKKKKTKKAKMANGVGGRKSLIAEKKEMEDDADEKSKHESKDDFAKDAKTTGEDKENKATGELLDASEKTLDDVAYGKGEKDGKMVGVDGKVRGEEKDASLGGASDDETSSSDEDTSSEEDAQKGVAHKVTAPKPHAKGSTKPSTLKVKMPFGDRMKLMSSKMKTSQNMNKSSPGSILAQCNFGFTSSPTTGAPIPISLAPPPKPQVNGTSSKGKPGGKSDDKADKGFSFIPQGADASKGYAKFEFAQTGEKMLRCVMHTCGQVFDTERFAEIHNSLHHDGPPRGLKCTLCDYKGHILKWYDMLRHLKQTHGSVLKPRILPPKKKKTEDDGDALKEGAPESKDGVPEKTGQPAEKMDSKESTEIGISSEKRIPDVGTAEDGTKAGETRDKDEAETSENKAGLLNEKVNGLSALADVCDKLEPIDTSPAKSAEMTSKPDDVKPDDAAAKDTETTNKPDDVKSEIPADTTETDKHEKDVEKDVVPSKEKITAGEVSDSSDKTDTAKARETNQDGTKAEDAQQAADIVEGTPFHFADGNEKFAFSFALFIIEGMKTNLINFSQKKNLCAACVASSSRKRKIWRTIASFTITTSTSAFTVEESCTLGSIYKNT